MDHVMYIVKDGFVQVFYKVNDDWVLSGTIKSSKFDDYF